MKIHFIAAIIIAFLQTMQVSAQNYPFTKEKKIAGKFTVGSADKLFIDNKYGDVIINTWDKKEITVDITITTKAKSEDKAQRLLDDITIEEKNNLQGGHQVSYKTITSTKNNLNGEIQVNYVINTPKKNAIDISNQFGDVSLGDFEGELRMVVAYGSFTAQKITGAEKFIKVSFGSSASIESIETGKLEISYTNITIKNAQNIKLKNEFGKSKITAVQTLDIYQRYGDLEIGSVGQITGSVSFANLDFDKLTKKADLVLEYCSRANLGVIETGVEIINIEASFGDLYFKMEKANLAIDVTTKFGDMDNDVKAIELVASNPSKDRYTSNYKGKAGKGGGTMTININYGDVNFD